MGSLTNYAENALTKHIFTEAAYTPAATLYMALCTADPGETATGASMSECANANGYSRKAISFGAAASRTITGSGTVTYDAATGSWGTVSHWAIVDSGTYGAGNVLAYAAWATPKSVVNGNTPSFSGSDVSIAIDASTGLSNYAANGFLDRMFRNQAFTVSATYLALATATLSDSTTSPTEVSGNNYARKLVNAAGGASPAWEAAVNGVTQNAHDITFATPSGSWGTIVAVFVADASTAGNVLMYDNGIPDQLVSASDVVRYVAGSFDFSQS
jgi:hypothetical protein